ncbi:MAG: response regulator [Desulfobacteraceae bacterium]|jgi:PAS domain S-box-containing protein
MLPQKIIIQSAGSFSVAVIAFLMFVLQTLLFLKKKEDRWYAWGSAVSFSAMLYAIGIFIEYNSSAGSLNRFSGLLEWAALILLIHCMFGFTFSYLDISGKRYHIGAGLFNFFIMTVLWITDYLVSDEFSSWHFLNLDSPYVEPALGPLGPLFVLYIAISAVCGMIIWIKHKGTYIKYRVIFLSGIGIWILLGIHDGLVCLGIPSLQYMMEYGFLAFSFSVLWVVINSYMETEADEKYRVITEYAGESIIIIQDEKIVFGNPAFCELTGQPLIDYSAKSFITMMLPEDRVIYRNIYNALLDGDNRTDRHTVCILRNDGENRFLDIVTSSIEYRGRPAILGIMRDITEQKREEENLRETEEKLTRLKKMESLGLLAGGVAHDLNNVLSGIVNYPELMLMDLPENSKLRKPLEGIQASGNRAVAIVQDLLTVARGVAVQRELLNINELVLDYLDSPELDKLKQFHPAVSITASLVPDLSRISASAIHIRKVLMNLVSNASEAIEGHGNVIVSTENCKLRKPLKGYEAVEAGEYVLLSVSDSGPGISQSDLERIFEPFYTKKVMGRSGTGLGLSVVWNIVRDHKGFIDIISSEKGTSFKLYFPVDKHEIKAENSPVPLADYKGNGETILVVDDVDTQRDITCSILKRLGYSVVALPNGEDVVEYMKEHSADLMVIDMIMDPGINGRQTYEKIRQIHPGQKAIIVSGFAETDDVKKAIETGAGRFIKKPFSLEAIGRAVKEELIK